MLKFKLLINVILLIQVANSINTDYCNMASCKGRAHIGCQPKLQWAKICPSDAELILLTDEQKDLALDLHNKMRNIIASGKQPGFKPAVRMATMVWDEELEYLAALNVLQCEMEHDKCRNTKEFSLAGQNIAWNAQTKRFKTIPEVIEKSVKQWYDKEVVNATQLNIDECCTGYKIGHFLQMVQEKAIAVGCAMARYTTKVKWRNSLMTCNYARGNLDETPVYESGPSASKCVTGKNPEFLGLCSVDEPIDPNDY